MRVLIKNVELFIASRCQQHLRIIDRLIDVFARSRRNSAVARIKRLEGETAQAR
jgi:hypothetical protein